MFKVNDRVEFKAYKRSNGVPYIGTVMNLTPHPNPAYITYEVVWDTDAGRQVGRYMGHELLPHTQASLQHAWDDMGNYYVQEITGKQPSVKACTCGGSSVKDHGHARYCDLLKTA